jgi:tricorn protease
MLKRIILSMLVMSVSLPAILFAQEDPLWMRQSMISPDGSRIAFEYKGDIFIVPSQGGKAVQLTTNAAYDGYPVWSPDGSRIAFESDREGSLDIFVVSSGGGEPKRLTTYTGAEKPVAFRDNTHVLFLCSERPSTESMQFPSAQFKQLYEVSVEGGRAKMVTSMPMESISINADGQSWLYQDKKGYEDEWRKHHQSSITRDIWLYTPQTNKYEKLTTFKGEDRNPVWAADGRSFYYLSEQNGSFNVFRRELHGATATQLTHFEKNPVRFLSAGSNGLLCFGYDGEIYTLRDGSQPQKVKIQIVSDNNDQALIRQIKRSGATDLAVSPSGKEVAFVLRGDVYVTSVEYATTKQITDTPDQERDVDFAPDGRSLVYSSERNGLWQVYRTSIVKPGEKLFTYATDLKEENITQSDRTSFQPKFSPDGKEVAFLENRTTLRVVNLKSHQVRTVMDGKYNYSYQDGDQRFAWSPDSRWLLSEYIGHGGWNNQDIVLINADGKGELHDLTESGYSDMAPKWVLGGKAMIWASDRAGYRSHGSWGAETDEYIMFFDVDAYDRFMISKEDLALVEEAEKAEKDKKDKAEAAKKGKKDKAVKDGDKKKDGEKTDSMKPLVFDLENCKDRIVRLTGNSSFLNDAVLTPKGDKLYYISSFDDDGDLWVHNLKENETKIVLKNIGSGMMMLDKDGKNIFMLSRGGLKKVGLDDAKTTPIQYEAFFNYRPVQERAYIFDHVWKQVKEKFYDPTIRGIDWDGYHTAYARFLPHIDNNYDFQDMLSEFLGELNGSHTGARYNSEGPSLADAALGVFYDDTYTGEGLKIKEIIPKSPLTLKKNDAVAGCIIEKIDGKTIDANMDYHPLLEGKAGKKVLLSIYNPQGGKRFDVAIKALSIGAENELLYKRWVERNRKMVDKLSNGQLGYIHIKGMDSPSFRTLYSELLGRYREKKAVIIDTRHNGGGWLHDDVITLLSGVRYVDYVPRGQYIGSDPYNKWTKPSCMLVCEDNYSNAHGTPWLYKELKVGKLVGAPVPGTMTAVWWEHQIDPTLVFGIPEIGCKDRSGNYLENHELEPDVLVYDNPADFQKGKDAQLEEAVKTLMGN